MLLLSFFRALVFSAAVLAPGVGASPVDLWPEQSRLRKAWLTPFLAPLPFYADSLLAGSDPDDAAAQGLRPAVIICPGGSYFWLDLKTEGEEVALWLQAEGISAFVLQYRTAGVPAFCTHYRYLARGHRFPDPQDDLARALEHVHTYAADYGVDPQKIGVMGFSAGGHLAMSAAAYFPPPFRPRFAALLYPVVTMEGPWVHKRSRRALLGDNRQRDRRLRDSLSLERHIPADCPPVFLVNCQDDPTVHYRNAELLDSALTAAAIPHLYLQYPTGGHGFGASPQKGSPQSRTWPAAFLHWLHQLLH